MTHSIVIPTLNRPGYLNVLLETLATQVDSSVEIIVVDDGSEPSCSEEMRRVCTRYSARYLHHEYNRGMAVARNTGAAKSTGTWLVFLDDDVKPRHDWFSTLQRLTTNSRDKSVVGFEGKIVPTGDGLWDKEVQNLNGGLYLTSHIVYRREAFFAAGGFDTAFEFRGPFAEDHELAIRMLHRGSILFAPELEVSHMPRTVHSCKLLRNAPRRIFAFLKAEQYFYTRHPDEYRAVRFAPTFWATYRNVVTRHAYTALHRRGRSALLKSPGQACLLLVSSLIEQVVSVLVFPMLCLDGRKKTRPCL